MLEINYLAIVVAVVVSFVASTVYYIIFSKQRAKLSPTASAETRPRPSKIVVELIRNLILAFVLLYFVRQLGVTTWVGAVELGLIFWIGFPVMLLTGSIMWENVPWKLALIHIGDWLVKLILLALILGLWR